jgi:hypothetical protein
MESEEMLTVNKEHSLLRSSLSGCVAGVFQVSALCDKASVLCLLCSLSLSKSLWDLERSSLAATILHFAFESA